MDKAKRAKLEARGYWAGDAADFLALDVYERKLVDYRVRLSIGAREARERAGLTQADVAKLIGTTQPQIARVEAGTRGVSVELMLKALFAAGGDLSTLPALGPPNRPTRMLERTRAAVKPREPSPGAGVETRAGKALTKKRTRAKA